MCFLVTLLRKHKLETHICTHIICIVSLIFLGPQQVYLDRHTHGKSILRCSVTRETTSEM